MKLNLGCGKDILDGWENLDLFPTDDRVRGFDIRDIGENFADVEAIRAIDVLEHISRKEVLPTLQGWFKALKPGGTVEIRCPDLWKQAQCLLHGVWDTDTYAHMVFGGQDSLGNFHKAGFTAPFLTQLLTNAGFQVTKAVPEHDDIKIAGNANFRIFAVKP